MNTDHEQHAVNAVAPSPPQHPDPAFAPASSCPLPERWDRWGWLARNLRYDGVWPEDLGPARPSPFTGLRHERDEPAAHAGDVTPRSGPRANRGTGRVQADAIEPESTLTEREIEVMRWTALGKTACDVADILVISTHTVNFHIKNASAKLNATNKTAAAVRAAVRGLLGDNLA
jgi:DNA-binding CsgD family transcriptional regulator